MSDEGITIVQKWEGLWQEYLKLPGTSKVFVGIGAWLALSILSFTISGFIVGAFGIVLIHTNWPNLITHLSNIENSGRLPKESRQIRDERLAAEQGWQGEQTNDEDLAGGQEIQSKEPKLASNESLRNVARVNRNAPRNNEQPDELLREAKKTLKKRGRGTSYEDSERKARAMSLLQTVVGKFPDSREAEKARSLMEKLRGYSAIPGLFNQEFAAYVDEQIEIIEK